MKQHIHPICKFTVSVFCSLFIIFTSYPNPCFAETRRIEIPSSPNPVGSGARALGMGGALIAVADDATAASWNPAGLLQLDLPEISVVLDGFHRIEDNTFGNQPDNASGPQTVSKAGINYLSATYPFSLWGRNMNFSLNYQHLYDFTQKWNIPLEFEEEYESERRTEDHQQEGRLSALGIAYAVQVNLNLSFGFTLNIWDNDLTGNEWEQKAYSYGSLTVKPPDGNGDRAGESYAKELKLPFGISSVDKYSFSGINANFGILWEKYYQKGKKLSIGAVFKMPFTADLEHEASSCSLNPGDSEPNCPHPSEESASLKMPMSYGIGVAYRFCDEFIASLDLYRTEWDDCILTDTNFKGERKSRSPITGKEPDDVDPTHQIRAGLEYLIIGSEYIFPLRMGAFYDPAPAEGSPDDFFGFSIGSGIGDGECFAFDIAYQYRFGNDVRKFMLDNLDFSQDVKEHTVYASVIIYF